MYNLKEIVHKLASCCIKASSRIYLSFQLKAQTSLRNLGAHTAEQSRADVASGAALPRTQVMSREPFTFSPLLGMVSSVSAQASGPVSCPSEASGKFSQLFIASNAVTCSSLRQPR